MFRLFFFFYRPDFIQSSHVPFCTDEFCFQKSGDQFFRHFVTGYTTPETEQIHVIIFNPLMSGEIIMN